MPDWLPLTAARRRSLPRLWTHLLGQAAFHAELIEDTHAPAGSRPLGICLSVVLDRHWDARLQAAAPACATAALYEDLASGQARLPAYADLARLNAEHKLSVFVLHCHTAGPVSDAACAQLLASAWQGLRVQRVYHEERPGALAQIQPGMPLWSAPRLGLGATEQRILRLAVAGIEDAAIAAELGITERSVRHAWQVAGQRVCVRMPDLCEVAPCSGALPEAVRQRLLAYLAGHPEELRPFQAPEPDTAACIHFAPLRR